ncbi:EamA family transporter [Tumebacillus sp. ITR2]|uniref:EamA family transporter n=1 Tax=Tumebacillus amylolyticus TaxID=2801339 RepID=A0ABS1JDJ9_9BACL|nr:EamA family transporter [Tumebacillus amylolyticus]MBL0388341.1 EamA family transporter [Tumebacillus amylolyticus]
MSWLVMALLSAVFASFVAILGKIGMSGVDSNLATAIRAVVMAVASVVFVAFTGSLGKIGTVDKKALLFILFSGLAGAASWMFYFGALRLAPASKVAPIDRLSVVFTLILAALFLKEKISFGIVAGCVLIVAGSILIARA